MGRGKRTKKKIASIDEEVEEKKKVVLSPWHGTGVLGTLEASRDIKIDKFSVSMAGTTLIVDTLLELNHGNRYGLIGANGTGKSTMLKVLAERQVPIPDHVDIYFLDGEVDATELSALECVLEKAATEVLRLELEAENLTNGMNGDEDEVQDRLTEIYDRLDELDATTAEKRAGRILFGLGFDKMMQQKKTKDFSGGWRMRIALAQALFISPQLLLLDEPTNHLDLEACVWLEEELAKYTRCLVMVSHSQDFLNGVCTNIIQLQSNKLKYFKGNFDTYCRVRADQDENQMKRYKKEQEEIAHMKDYIARFGHGSRKLARQGKSMEKKLARKTEEGLVSAVAKDHILKFSFFPCGEIPPPVLQFSEVSFGYSENLPLIYKRLEFGVDLDSRVALVGPNGAGKSTLLKLMCRELEPTTGMVRAHNKLKIGRYHQHLQDLLDMEATPLEFFQKEFPMMDGQHNSIDKVRAQVGRYGISGKNQTAPIKQMSDGLKSRLVFAWLAYQYPHMLLLDEPTNHLDLETIDALAAAINEFEGGLVLVSHDFRLIDQVADEIWECKGGRVTPWEGDIRAYKEKLRQSVFEEMAAYDA